MSIYKPCDIRGKVPSELWPELYRSWGITLGHEVEPGAKFVVGGDVRYSTPEFLAALVEGLCLAGVDAVTLGIVPTPMVYHAKRRTRAAGCAIVTASHNPPEFNGLKWMLGDNPPTAELLERLGREAERTERSPSNRRRTESRTLDVSFDYVARLQEIWVDTPHIPSQVVLDPMHGCWSQKARRYLQAVFPHVVFSAVHDQADTHFGGATPDCSQPERLQRLSETVDRQRAQLGIAFDGDGDRMAMVDDDGVALSAEEAAMIFLKSFGRRLEGEAFVHDLKFSDRIAQTARRAGAEPVVERSGHAFIRGRMLATGALFGAEISGHYFFGELDGGDDGLFAACWMIDYLARCGRTLGELRRQCPPVFLTPDLRLPIDPTASDELIEAIRLAWSEYPQLSIDGVRVDFPDGWALVRASVTEPVLTFRFESTGLAELERLVRRYCDRIPKLGNQLWDVYRARAEGE